MNTPEGKGADIVKSVTDKVHEIFGGNDHNFMNNVAAVESNNGEHPNTYRAGYNGGIWQVDKIGFEATQDTKSHPRLKAKFVKIKEKTGIDWEKVKWEDLKKPLYSGIAARLYLLNIPDPIPEDINAQAEYWKKHYNTSAGAGSADKFVTAAGKSVK